MGSPRSGPDSVPSLKCSPHRTSGSGTRHSSGRPIPATLEWSTAACLEQLHTENTEYITGHFILHKEYILQLFIHNLFKLYFHFIEFE